MPPEGGFDYAVLQQVSNELMLNLGQQAQNFSGDRSLLAEQLVQMLQKSLRDTQLGFRQPNHFDSYRANQEMAGASSVEVKQAVVAPVEVPNEDDEKFHEMVSVQVKQTVR